jgi:hypothetical protein
MQTAYDLRQVGRRPAPDGSPPQPRAIFLAVVERVNLRSYGGSRSAPGWLKVRAPVERTFAPQALVRLPPRALAQPGAQRAPAAAAGARPEAAPRRGAASPRAQWRPWSPRSSRPEPTRSNHVTCRRQPLGHLVEHRPRVPDPQRNKLRHSSKSSPPSLHLFPVPGKLSFRGAAHAARDPITVAGTDSYGRMDPPKKTSTPEWLTGD